jgi:hypothetical protein
MFKLTLVHVGLILFVGCLAIADHVAVGADHREAPALLSNGALDLNDIYLFQSPENPNNVVFILTVNPFAAVNSPTTFDPRAVYEFNIDTNADAIPNIVYQIYFSAPRNGAQRFVVIQSTGGRSISGQTGRVTDIPGGGKVTAGLFDDPFFFDLSGFRNGLNFTGVDAFARANISAVVLELPRSLFPTNIKVFGRTANRGGQVDRTGLPAIATVLIPASTPGLRDQFNRASPSQDVALFRNIVLNSLTSPPLSNSPERAASLADVLLPDVSTIDTSSSAGFLNGRRLQDDVIDAELGLLSNGAVTTDLVNSNDKTFLTTFPYLAAPHVLAP